MLHMYKFGYFSDIKVGGIYVTIGRFMIFGDTKKIRGISVIMGIVWGVFSGICSKPFNDLLCIYSGQF